MFRGNLFGLKVSQSTHDGSRIIISFCLAFENSNCKYSRESAGNDSKKIYARHFRLRNEQICGTLYNRLSKNC